MSLMSSIARRSRTLAATARPARAATVTNHRTLTTAAPHQWRHGMSSTSRLGLMAAAVTAFSIGAYHLYHHSSALYAENTSTKGASGGLDAKNWTPLRLKAVDRYNHNSNVYHFELPDPNGTLQLPVSSCIMTKYTDPDTGKDVVRPYTPIDTHHRGELILLVKTYEKGKMSKHIAELKPGDTLDIKGPVPKLKYEPNMKKKLGFIVGGTGVTPALQVVDEVLSNPSDKTELHLLFANISGRDVLLRETIDQWAKIHPNFHVTYIIDSNDRDKDWKGEIGRIDKSVIDRLLPIKASEGKDVLVYVCGPPAMYDSISGGKAKDYSQGPLAGALKELGFTEEQVYKF